MRASIIIAVRAILSPAILLANDEVPLLGLVKLFESLSGREAIYAGRYYQKRRYGPMRLTPGTCPAALRRGMRSVLRAIFTGRSRCARRRRSGPTSARWSGSRRGCWGRFWVGRADSFR